MPSTSAKQAKFMRAVAHSPSFAKKVGVPTSVGKDFSEADKKMKKFGKGGAPLMESQRKPIDTRRAVLGSDKDIVERGNRTPYEPTPKTGPDMPKRKLGPAGKAGFKCGGEAMKKYAKGGGIEKKGKTKGTIIKMAKGGSIDGIAMKGKTRCKGAK
jgi:hypothetical protein